MTPRRSLLAILLCLPLLASVPATLAGDKQDKKARKAQEREEVRQALQRGEILPLARILAIAGTYVDGDLIEIELERKPTQFIYEVKVLTRDGDVRKLKLDARDGSLVDDGKD